LKILITGLGVTGKSSLLKWLDKIHPPIPDAIFLDLDHDRAELSREFSPWDYYFLEDVHGPTAMAVYPLPVYDLVLYVLPGWFTHLRYWLSRMRIWFENGKYAWDPDLNCNFGTGQPQDWRNLPGIIKYFWQHFPKRGQTISEDLIALKASRIKTFLVIPKGIGAKISFTFKKF